jgi:putative FmdB family regulatory protein
MPTYLYECPIHGEFEHEHSITEQLEFCPICQSENRITPQKVKRLIASGTNFILGGSGWAREGYSK